MKLKRGFQPTFKEQYLINDCRQGKTSEHLFSTHILE